MSKLINIHISNINRSGGSLLVRLFDGHPDIGAYPVEFGFPKDHGVCDFITPNFTGYPCHVPEYVPDQFEMALELLEISESEIPVKADGSSQNLKIGVGQNYLEKEYYGKVRTSFDYKLFTKKLKNAAKVSRNFEELFNFRHRAYFESWDNNAHAGTLQYVVTHASDCFYMNHPERFYDMFPESYYLVMVRDPRGYIGSEKLRYARRYLGAERFAGLQPPRKLIRRFRRYDLDAHILAWNVAFTRVVLMQEQFKEIGRFVPLKYENLVNQTQEVMQALCSKMDIQYNPILTQPTLMGKDWKGNSHYGKQSGVNPQLTQGYKKVLTASEINRIKDLSGPLLEYIDSMKEPLSDFTTVPKELLFDYEKHRKYYLEDSGKAILYGALSNSHVRRYPLGFPGRFAGIALLFFYLMKLYRRPRDLFLKLFPDIFRKNYK